MAMPIGLNGESGVATSNVSKSTDLMLSSARNMSSIVPDIWLRLSMERQY